MKNFKTALAILSSLTIMCTAFSCGKSANESGIESNVIDDISASSSDNNSDINNNKDETSSENYENSESNNDDNNSKDDTDTSDDYGNKTPEKDTNSKNNEESKSDNSNNKNETSNGTSDKNSNNSSGNSESNSSDKNNTGKKPDSSQDSNNNNNSGNGNNGNSNSNSSSSSGSNQNVSGSGGGNSSAPSETTEPATEAPTKEPINYTAEISLSSSSSYTGNNVSISGSKITITSGGTYRISGTLSDGQLEVNTTEKVTLHLNGVNITNSSGPAICITDAKRAEIKLLAGTSSTLKDGGKDKINDGVIFSNDTLEFKGSGTLNIISGNAHGIVSDDDIIINKGNYNITSIKSGLFANDDITINDGNLNIKGGTNGIKSKGTLNINGGYSVISGGTKEEKSSIYAAGAFNYTNGYVYAAGNVVSVPTNSSFPYVVAGFNSSMDSGTKVTLLLNNSDIVTMTPHNNFRCVMMLSPDIASGDSFAMKLDDKRDGGYNISGIKNVFTLF